MKIFIAGLFFLSLTSDCTGWKGKKVIITKDYVINPNWDEVDNFFVVCRMKLKDSNQVIDLRNPSDLYNDLIEDTSFLYTANVKYNGEDYAIRKVYFNRDNGFLWRKDPHSTSGFKSIGEFEKETWYLLEGLSRFETLYYIYLDNSDSLHVFKISGMSNF